MAASVAFDGLGRGPVRIGWNGFRVVRSGEVGFDSEVTMRRRAFELVVAGCAFFACACGDGPARRDVGTVGDSAGVRIVRLPPPEAGTDRVRSLSLDPAWGPSDTVTFGELVDLEVLPDGRVFALDRALTEVVVLDDAGRVERRFGGPGEGPGEFTPAGLATLVATDTSVLVPDLQQQRIAEFTLDGELLESRSFPGGGGYAVDWTSHPAGGLAYRLLDRSGDRIVRWAGETVDTLYRYPPVDAPPNTLLGPTAFWGLGPEGGLIVGRSDRTAVEARSADGSRLRWVARAPEALVELTEADRSSLEALVLESAGRRGMRGASREEVLSLVEFPRHVPRLAAVHWTPDDRIWIGLAKAVGEMDMEALRVGIAAGFGGSEWIVLDGSGRFLRRVRFPETFTPRAFLDGRIYGIAADGFGVRTVARVEGVEGELERLRS